jgi:DNA-binding MarR family transcriptional regulator
MRAIDSYDDPLPCVIAKLGRLLERRIQRGLADHDISASQFVALGYIAMHPGISRADLARGIQITPQAAGGLTAQLAGKDLIVRTPSLPGLPTAFTPTETGVRLLHAAEPALQALTREMLQLFAPNLAAVMNRAPRHLLTKLGCEDPTR